MSGRYQVAQSIPHLQSFMVQLETGEMRVSVVVDRACGVRGEEVISRYEEEFVRLEDTLPLDFMGEGPEQDEGKRRDGTCIATPCAFIIPVEQRICHRCFHCGAHRP